MRVFIIGITGQTGSRVARKLLEQGDVVSGLYRNAQQADLVRSLGAKGTLGDLSNISDQDLAVAFAGFDVILFAAGASEKDPDSMIDAVDEGGVHKCVAAMRLAGVERLLLISVFPEAWREKKLGDSFEHYMRAKKRAEIFLVSSDVNWLILRPSALSNENAQNTVKVSAAEWHDTLTRDDLAQTVVTLLHTHGLNRLILEVTAGDEPIQTAVAKLIPLR